MVEVSVYYELGHFGWLLFLGGGMIQLTDEETEMIVARHRKECEPCDYSFVEAGAEAQLKKVVDWGNEDCPHNREDFYSGEKRPRCKHQCPKCWQALLEEVKE